MQISENGIKFICEFEGYFNQAYKDQAGIWTIGYGTIKYPDGTKVSKGDNCTKQEAKNWLAFEISEKCSYFNQVIARYNLVYTQNEYDALVSFFYNVGIGKCYPNTTMGDAILSHNKKAVAEAFLVYNKYTGIFGIKRISSGLDRRRKAEKALFEGL